MRDYSSCNFVTVLAYINSVLKVNSISPLYSYNFQMVKKPLVCSDFFNVDIRSYGSYSDIYCYVSVAQSTN